MKLFNTLLVSTALLSASAIAQEQDLKPAIDTAKEINESAAKSQQKIDGITDQIDSKLQQFKVLNKEIEGLEIYNEKVHDLLRKYGSPKVPLELREDRYSHCTRCQRVAR